MLNRLKQLIRSLKPRPKPDYRLTTDVVVDKNNGVIYRDLSISSNTIPIGLIDEFRVKSNAHYTVEIHIHRKGRYVLHKYRTTEFGRYVALWTTNSFRKHPRCITLICLQPLMNVFGTITFEQPFDVKLKLNGLLPE